MITREEQHRARDWAWHAARAAGLVLREEERDQIEVADFGLSRLSEVGAQILTLESNFWVSVKVLILSPWQLEPQHRHPPSAVDAYPGKTEVLRCWWGELYHYHEGSPTPSPHARPQAADREYLTEWHESILRPADQLTLQPNTWHWFQAGPAGAVVWTISSRSTEAEDQWMHPRVVRATVVSEQKNACDEV